MNELNWNFLYEYKKCFNTIFECIIEHLKNKLYNFSDIFLKLFVRIVSFNFSLEFLETYGLLLFKYELDLLPGRMWIEFGGC